MRCFVTIVAAVVLAACGRPFPPPEEGPKGLFLVEGSGDTFQFGVDGVSTQYRLSFAGTGFEVGGQPVTEVVEFGIAVADRGKLVFDRTGILFRKADGTYDGTTLPGPTLQRCTLAQSEEGAVALSECEDVQAWPFAGTGNWMAAGSLRLVRQ